jgi:AsmA protein
MGRVFKLLLILLASLVVLAVVAILVFSLVFDPNDYRDRIAAEVEAATGREFVIEGELGLRLFPWLAVEMGRTELGNAEGFGPEPFMNFDAAALSVRLLPMLLRREFEVGAVRLDGLTLNLAVDEGGRSNWQDLLDRQSAADDVEVKDDEAAAPASLDIGSIEIVNANLTYADRQSGSTYRLEDLNAATGAIRPGEPVEFDAGFGFATEPGGMAGSVSIRATVGQDEATLAVSDLAIEGQVVGDMPLAFALAAPAMLIDTAASRVSPGKLEFKVYDLTGTAAVEPFTYDGDVTPRAALHIDAFSPRSLMQALAIEVPPTADPAALTRLLIDTRVAMGTETITLDNLAMTLDDTHFTGELSLPMDPEGRVELSLAADAINADRYMAPAGEADAAATAGEEPPLEIPVELIRALNAAGVLTIGEVLLGGMTFTDVELGVNSANAKMRIHPFTAAFFDGRYEGDIRIDAAGDTATLSANERIRDVSLAPLAKAAFEQDNISGLVNGTFALNGRGNDMGEIQKTLNGKLSFTLADGAYEGVDIWYQLRRARALLREEAPPEPSLPARTPFSDVSATGIVTNGVMQNEDFVAVLPFMRLAGKGSVNLVSGGIDYSLTGKVYDRPEGVGATAAGEVGELAKATIPLKITGTLTEPKVGVEIADAVKERVKDQLRDRVLKELQRDEAEAADGETAEEKDPEEAVKDELKDRLRNLLDR